MVEQLPKLSRFKLPRSLVPISFGSVISYHHFVDASQSGYGTASYLKMVNASERVYWTLVMAQARIAPLKPTTIPRLELTAATVAARMVCKLRKELGLKLEDSVFWTDSTSVLNWPQVPKDVKHGSLEDDVEVKVSVMVCETVTTVMSFIEEFASRFSNWQKVGGRLRHSGRNFNATHPIILSNKSSLVKLMVRWHHKKGTNCFGPFLIRKGRSNLKRYGIVFTCLSRAFHIEVMDSMETDSFINALRRFTARRGPVKSIRSDNGTNLVGAEKVLRQEPQLLDQTAICDTMSTRGISWCFNPPHASHFG
ncbi:uncharacterized protein [Penaeus vannamei]|uniref:uncharacterized protein n=1 Tax=Penaeus vannamei TaxID=6689 RepID=UPI00387F81E3